jgi:glycosyltransferase involved in cell wall biosynthesis
VPDGETPAPVRLAILSYSTGEFDARSFRVARSAIEAGYAVTVYARWAPGRALREQREGYALVRVAHSWQLGVPGLRGAARRRLAREVAESERRRMAGEVPGPAAVSPDPAAPGRPGLPRRVLPRILRPVRRWTGAVQMFPLRPLGWADALDEVAAPADLWHGMWAGSLPALARLRRRHGGRTIYDSRDVYLQSRELARLGRPLRPLLAALERRWARSADLVLTVNEPYADLLATQLGVPRPPVILNCPDRWEPPIPPEPAPDHLRTALGLAPATRVVLYQGQLIRERGIEQAMDAVCSLPDAVLCLLGYGTQEAAYRARAAEPPYAGRVFVLPAVPPEELLAWTASADVVVMPIQPTTVNHRFTTPQKLWEAIGAGVPVVASDLPGMAGIVREAGVGELCDPASPPSIAAALRSILDAPPDERAALRGHILAVAHQRYTWDTQAAALLRLCAELSGRR